MFSTDAAIASLARRGIGLDDAAAGDAFGHLPHQYLADQITSERDSIDRQLRTRERWMATLLLARFQGIRSTH
jgi:hypothetical protein